ncbi:MAG: GntR family transcriptional regulator [Alphaproteobacteria bacterium]|jgi:GntR family transcriptional regulator
MAENRFDNKLSPLTPRLQPLYKQVEEHLIQLIVEQRWMPGEKLPSEFDLAAELQVSQGTVRKALNKLTNDKVLTRRQGVGTFITDYASNHGLYRFFPVIADGKTPELPKAKVLSKREIQPNSQVLKALELSDTDKVIELTRLRVLSDEPFILETIYLASKYFSKLMDMAEVPHTLYHFYQTQFHLTVQKTHDELKAVIADAEASQQLGIAKGSPVLQSTRLTRSLAGKPIEFRISLCRTDKYHYTVDLG